MDLATTPKRTGENIVDAARIWKHHPCTSPYAPVVLPENDSMGRPVVVLITVRELRPSAFLFLEIIVHRFSSTFHLAPCTSYGKGVPDIFNCVLQGLDFVQCTRIMLSKDKRCGSDMIPL